ncbi:MAG: flagellar basal body-associated FliL family protein [Rhodospirillales bacterium]
MAEENEAEGAGEDEEGGEEGGEDEGESSSEGGNKKLLIIIGIVFLLVVGGAAAVYFTGLMEPVVKMFSGGESGGKEEKPGDAPQVANAPGESLFHDLPEILVNLNTGGRKSSFLKIKVALELSNANDLPHVEKFMPRVLDNFQVYLRELRIEDLKGSAGMYRLREELLTRVNAAVAPAKINDVLFKEMLVQ